MRYLRNDKADKRTNFVTSYSINRDYRGEVMELETLACLSLH